MSQFVLALCLISFLCVDADISHRVLHFNVSVDGKDVTKVFWPELFQKKGRSLHALSNVTRHRNGREALQFAREGEKCLVELQKVHQKRRFAVSTAVHAELHLTCHYCTDTSKDRLQGMLWFRIGRVLEGSGYRVSEVPYDLHDTEPWNRVIVTADHTLVIRRATLDDAGAYFCENTADMTLNYIHGSRLEHIMDSSDTFKVLYHVDVIPLSGINLRSVKTTGKEYPRPYPVENLEEENLKVLTNWEKWGECETCGESSVRRRIGWCTVTKLYPEEPLSSWHVEEMLTFYPEGLPCRSSLVTDIVSNIIRRDEVEIEICIVECKNKDRTINLNVFHQEQSDIQQEKFFRGAYTKEVGQQLRLHCPGAHIDTPVAWAKGSRYLSPLEVHRTTKGRVEVDALHSLRVHYVKLDDAATYSCWYHGKKKAEFSLKVPAESLDWDDIWVKASYLLMSFIVDFIIFLTILMIRHKNRPIQQKSTSYSALDSDSSSDSWSETSSDSSYTSSGPSDPDTDQDSFTETGSSESATKSSSALSTEPTTRKGNKKIKAEEKTSKAKGLFKPFFARKSKKLSSASSDSTLSSTESWVGSMASSEDDIKSLGKVSRSCDTMIRFVDVPSEVVSQKVSDILRSTSSSSSASVKSQKSSQSSINTLQPSRRSSSETAALQHFLKMPSLFSRQGSTTFDIVSESSTDTVKESRSSPKTVSPRETPSFESEATLVSSSTVEDKKMSLLVMQEENSTNSEEPALLVKESESSLHTTSSSAHSESSLRKVVSRHSSSLSEIDQKAVISSEDTEQSSSERSISSLSNGNSSDSSSSRDDKSYPPSSTVLQNLRDRSIDSSTSIRAIPTTQAPPDSSSSAEAESNTSSTSYSESERKWLSETIDGFQESMQSAVDGGHKKVTTMFNKVKSRMDNILPHTQSARPTSSSTSSTLSSTKEKNENPAAAETKSETSVSSQPEPGKKSVPKVIDDFKKRMQSAVGDGQKRATTTFNEIKSKLNDLRPSAPSPQPVPLTPSSTSTTLSNTKQKYEPTSTEETESDPKETHFPKVIGDFKKRVQSVISDGQKGAADTFNEIKSKFNDLRPSTQSPQPVPPTSSSTSTTFSNTKEKHTAAEETESDSNEKHFPKVIGDLKKRVQSVVADGQKGATDTFNQIKSKLNDFRSHPIPSTPAPCSSSSDEASSFVEQVSPIPSSSGEAEHKDSTSVTLENETEIPSTSAQGGTSYSEFIGNFRKRVYSAVDDGQKRVSTVVNDVKSAMNDLIPHPSPDIQTAVSTSESSTPTGHVRFTPSTTSLPSSPTHGTSPTKFPLATKLMSFVTGSQTSTEGRRDEQIPPDDSKMTRTNVSTSTKSSHVQTNSTTQLLARYPLLQHNKYDASSRRCTTCESRANGRETSSPPCEIHTEPIHYSPAHQFSTGTLYYSALSLSPSEREIQLQESQEAVNTSTGLHLHQPISSDGTEAQGNQMPDVPSSGALYYSTTSIPFGLRDEGPVALESRGRCQPSNNGRPLRLENQTVQAVDPQTLESLGEHGTLYHSTTSLPFSVREPHAVSRNRKAAQDRHVTDHDTQH